ncbi:MAG: YdcF family protein [Nitrospirae bacterium]|nr:YdcF family protein [Nitrospirota bacterium]
MFILLKLIKPFLLPPTLIAIGMATSFLLLLRKRQRLGKAFLLLTLATYYLLSIEPVAYLLAKNLENKMAIGKMEEETANVEAIVVLAGGIDKKGGHRPYHELSGISWRRLWHGIELYKEFKGKIPILYSGGSGDPFDPVSVEAELAMNYAVSMGIPKEKFWIENSSRNTYESGIEIKRILKGRFPGVERHRIILVTSALHMLRSMKVMKKAGINTIPSSADFAIGSLSLDPLSFSPSDSNFSISTFSIHEWIGIGGYWLLGRI